MIQSDTNEEEVKKQALENINVKKALGENQVKKVIYVKGRLINIVF